MLSTRGGLAPLFVFLLACTRGVARTTGLETVQLDLDEEKTGSIEPDTQANYVIDAISCTGYLHVELWDTGRGDADEAEAVADPMLMVRRKDAPSASYERTARDWRFSENTYVDLEGYRLIRAYHRVVVDMRSCANACERACASSSRPNCQPLCEVDCDEPDRDADKPFIVGIKNVRLWVHQPLEFRLRTTCVSEVDGPPCPRPLGVAAGECAGRGECGPPDRLAGGEVNRLALASGVCACADGWGDVGCDRQLEKLVANDDEPTIATVPAGEWAYFYVDVVAASADPEAALLVEMRRDGGDPVLFVKRADGSGAGDSVSETDGEWVAEGADSAWETASTGTTPWVGDFDDFADADGFRSRLNYHYLMLAGARAGRYYVAVFNNDAYLTQTARVSVNARVAFGAAADDPLCPMACGADDASAPRGSCLPPPPPAGAAPAGTCQCADGFAGVACEGTLATTSFAESDAAGVSGRLEPGDWAYVRFEVDVGAANAGVAVEFRHRGGHPVLLLSRGEIPSLLDAHFVLSTSDRLASRAQFRIGPHDLSPGMYFIALHNMNYYAEDACEYVVAVGLSFADEYGMTGPGFMTVVLVVVMGMLVFVALSVCRKLFMRAMRRRGDGISLVGWDDDRGDPAAPGGARLQGAPGGCPRAVVDAIPRVVFGSDAWDSVKRSVEDESCSVCIDAFECGETVLCLPECQHAFHKDCIEGWLARNTTCPNCRASLVSAEAGEDVEAGRPGRGGAAPASHPGVVEGVPTSADFDRTAAEARAEMHRWRRGGTPVAEAPEPPAGARQSADRR